jgi:hypothetical protein
MLMPRVRIRINLMSNDKIEISCQTVGPQHSRPYDTPEEARKTLLRLGVPEDVARAYLSQLPANKWLDAGEFESPENALKETGFTAV